MRKKNARPKAGLLADCGPSKTSVADRPGLTRRSAMERLACVSLPAFPLQLLLRSHPDWAGYPAVVIDEDKPQGSDRKSTRLNSSHRTISYAVFCLKKKKSNSWV